MARYIRFETEDGGSMLVEVEEHDVTPQGGVTKAGIKEKISETVTEARTTFQQALEQAVRHNADAIMQSVSGLSQRPDSVEVTFALKVTGEASNIAVGRLGGEMNYEIKLTWKPVSQDK